MTAHVGLSRFDRRWRLVGAGIFNVWRFGTLELRAPTGRLLLRGLNGTGKTTALEGLFPYLLDLNAAKLVAGKSRTTSLSSLMREGANGAKRRYGYTWLTIEEPNEGLWSFGVRIQYSEGASPPVRVVPFTIPGRPLYDLKLCGPARESLTVEQFHDGVTRCEGQVFDSEELYVAHVATRIYKTPDVVAITSLAQDLRQVRNPTLLGDISPQAASDALRESLPGVAEEVIVATADALAASDETREAFERDCEAAELLAAFSDAWCAHATEVVRTTHQSAVAAANQVVAKEKTVKALAAKLASARDAAESARERMNDLEASISAKQAEIEALMQHEAYKDAGRLSDLERTYEARASEAATSARALVAAAAQTASRANAAREQFDTIHEDLGEVIDTVLAADSAAIPAAFDVSRSDEPRRILSAGAVEADPGPKVIFHGDPQSLRDGAEAWARLAGEHSARAEAATLALTDHKPIVAFMVEALAAEKKSGLLRSAAELAVAKRDRAEQSARTEASALVGAITAWTTTAHGLMGDDVFAKQMLEASLVADMWSTTDVETLAAADPSQVLDTADGWAATATLRAERVAAALVSRAGGLRQEALALGEEARRFRDEAAALRAGRLLPLPRPEWAGPGDDALALGALLEWNEGVTERQQALIENALGASGLLGATLHEGGAETLAWRVDASAPPQPQNLASALAVDPDHPSAKRAIDVLERVALSDSADFPTPTALVIGRDGSFRAGVLLGHPSTLEPPPPQHVGARKRHAAAQSRAARLEEKASSLESAAGTLEGEARRLRDRAADVQTAGCAYPSRDALRRSEVARAQLETTAYDALRSATEAAEAARHRQAAFEAAEDEWRTRTRARGLPTDIDALTGMRDRGRGIALAIANGATKLSKLAGRFERVLSQVSEDERDADLAVVEAAARAARDQAQAAGVAVQVLRETAGAAIAEVLARLSTAKAHLQAYKDQVQPTQQDVSSKERIETETEVKLTTENSALAQARPAAAVTLAALRGLLETPGVIDAVLDGDAPADGDALLPQVEGRLEGRKTLPRKTVLQHHDQVRDRLAGTWSLDLGEDRGDLLTYALTYRDAVYTPTAAAAHAANMKTRAEQALAASEERALRDFVLGRLPSAIGTAWTRLHDWVKDVNRKMKSAAASSGVGVRVHVPLRSDQDLPPAARTVYELACLVSDAERTGEQQRQLSEALQQLFAASVGDTMRQRVEDAVDIREWVDVYYEVTRPDGKTQRWNSKTGLSSGERRLVVLAPMLAALAASYDAMGEKALRIVALDEIPAEVDERGRDGLARYLAELDLDLVCTSHMWDGCPGAWDGIDAHDLEAADGMVVGSWMMVRGQTSIPGDGEP